MARIDLAPVQDRLDVIGRETAALAVQFALLRNTVDQLRQAIGAKDEQIAKLCDRIVELAMVRQGAVVDSVAHRRAAALEETTQTTQALWEAEVEDEDEWPPKGFQTYPTP